ncbi:MAG: hypothetical protein ACON40_11175 [Ilumatobacteraceae bacterium]
MKETDLTSIEANELYFQTGVQVLVEGGMRPALSGQVVTDTAATTIPAWDQVAIARYPSYEAFFALSQSPDLQLGLEHKDAGIATTTVMPTIRVVDAPIAADLPPADDPVVLLERFSHAGAGVTQRPDALTNYLDALATAATEVGGVALGTYEVQGVLIGDGRDWDEARVWWFANGGGLETLLADQDLVDVPRPETRRRSLQKPPAMGHPGLRSSAHRGDASLDTGNPSRSPGGQRHYPVVGHHRRCRSAGPKVGRTTWGTSSETRA